MSADFGLGTTKIIDLRIEVAGVVQAHRQLRGVVAGNADLTAAFEAIANHFQAHMVAVFDTEGGATKHGQWAPLERAYAKQKADDPEAHTRILDYTGALRTAMTGGAGGIRKISAHEMTVGGSRMSADGEWDVAMAHQTGTDIMPARPIIDLPEAMVTQFMHDLADHLLRER